MPGNDSTPDDSEALEDPVLLDEWPTTCSNPMWSDNCQGDLETPYERKKGLCSGCLAVIDSWRNESETEPVDKPVTTQTTLMTDGGTTNNQDRNHGHDDETDTEQNSTRWEETGDICSDCSYNGPHLIVDDELLYCGRCKNKMNDLA